MFHPKRKPRLSSCDKLTLEMEVTGDNSVAWSWQPRILLASHVDNSRIQLAPEAGPFQFGNNNSGPVEIPLRCTGN